MCPQPDLFAGASYPDAPGYRNPTTSRDAAQAIRPKASCLREKVLATLKEHGPMTTVQLAAHLGWPYESLQPRTSELKAQDQIIDSGKRGPSRGPGKLAIVWAVKA